MPTLVIHAPKERENKPTPNYKSFGGIFLRVRVSGRTTPLPRIYSHGFTPDAALYCSARTSRGGQKGKLVRLVPTFKAEGNSMAVASFFLSR
jgi:hypothetical protein